MNYQAEPLSRAQLRALALQIRTVVGLEDRVYFPVLKFLELVMPVWFPPFQYDIAPKSEFPPSIHAYTDVLHHTIRIRSDVYDGACAGRGRDRMTIAHEIAHYMLLVVCGFKFARSFGPDPAVPYKDPEWQAKALAGEMMCLHHLINGMNPRQIARACGVSLKAANYAHDH
jgi:hypothetical protein